MCGCRLSLYGHIGLAPAGDSEPAAGPRLEPGTGDPAAVAEFAAGPGDWPCLRGDSRRTFIASVPVSLGRSRLWQSRPGSCDLPTAPVTGGEVSGEEARSDHCWRSIGCETAAWLSEVEGPDARAVGREDRRRTMGGTAAASTIGL